LRKVKRKGFLEGDPTANKSHDSKTQIRGWRGSEAQTDRRKGMAVKRSMKESRVGKGKKGPPCLG